MSRANGFECASLSTRSARKAVDWRNQALVIGGWMKPGWRWAIASTVLQMAVVTATMAGTGELRAATFGDSGGIPRDQVIEMVQRHFNARVVRINLVESGGRRVYEMRLLSEQRVWNVRVDADTGQVLESGN
jgi:hypothetical protein